MLSIFVVVNFGLEKPKQRVDFSGLKATQNPNSFALMVRVNLSSKLDSLLSKATPPSHLNTYGLLFFISRKKSFFI